VACGPLIKRMAIENLTEWLQQVITKLDAIPANDASAAMRFLHETSERAMNEVALIPWARFLSSEAHMLARGRGASLIQQASARADRSPLTQAIDAWLKTSKWSKPWLRKRGRPREDRSSPCLRTFEGSQGAILSIALLGDQKHIAATCQDGYLRVWEIATGICIRQLKGDLGSIASAPSEGRDAILAVPFDDPNPSLWRLESASLDKSLAGNTSPVTWLAMHASNRVAATCQDGTIRVWTLGADTPPQQLRGHTQTSIQITFSPDGRRALSGGADTTLRLWDIQSGACRVYKGHTAPVIAVAFTPDAKKAVSGGADGPIKVWDVDSAKNIATFPGHQGGTFSLQTLPHGRTFLSGGADKLVRLWDIESGTCLKIFQGHAGNIVAIQALPDGKRAISASDDGVLKLWDLEASAPAQVPDGAHATIFSVSFLPGGRRALSASTDNLLKLWETDAGTSMQTLKVGPGQLTAATAHLSESYAVTAYDDGHVRVWDLASNKQVKYWKAHNAPVSCLRLHIDAVRALTAGEDGSIKLWELESGRLIRSLVGHQQRVTQLELYPDGRRLVSLSLDKTLRVWDIDTGSCIGTYRGAHYAEVHGVALHQDGVEIALGPAVGVLLWDLGTGKQSGLLDSSWGAGDALCFSSDAQRLIAGGGGRSLRIFSMQTKQLVARWESDAPIVVCAVSPRGRIVFGDALGGVTFLDLTAEGER
jgi:WD40 repeat protein